MEFEDVPIRLEKTLDNIKFATQKLEFVKEDGKTKVKQEFPVYEAQENYELLCKLVRTYMRSVKDYNLFKLFGPTEVYDRFWQCLGGDSLNTWDALVENKKEQHWKRDLANLMTVLIGRNAYEYQKDYLFEVKKPGNMSVKSFALRLKAINAYLPVLGLENGEAP